VGGGVIVGVSLAVAVGGCVDISVGVRVDVWGVCV